MNRTMTTVILLVLVVATPVLAQTSSPPRPIVTIAPFQTGRTGLVPPPGFGETLAELLGERLVASGGYRVLELGLLAPEMAYARGGTVMSLEDLRRRAERAGVQYLVCGSLTQYSREQRQRLGGGAAGFLRVLLGARFHVPLAGGGTATTTDAVLGISVRIIDVGTGEIVTVADGAGIASRTNRAAGGFGVAGGAPLVGGFANSSLGSTDAMLQEALRQAVDRAAQSLTEAATRRQIVRPAAAGKPSSDESGSR